MAKLGKRDGLKHHCPKGLAGSNPAPGTLRGRADRRVRGPSGPAAERLGAGSTAATARRRTPEGEYDVTNPRTLSESIPAELNCRCETPSWVVSHRQFAFHPLRSHSRRPIT